MLSFLAVAGAYFLISEAWKTSGFNSDIAGKIYRYTNYTNLVRAGNMELSVATSPFINHQPRSIPDWTQIPPVQVRLHMTLPPRTIEE